MLHKWVHEGETREGEMQTGIEIDWHSMSECQSGWLSHCMGNEGCFKKGTSLLILACGRMNTSTAKAGLRTTDTFWIKHWV